MPRILVLHGPNLDALGTREPETYGRETLDDIDRDLRTLARELHCEIDCQQSAHEGVLIESLYRARGTCDGVLLNPGGLTHTSVALRDAVLGSGLPVIEVHVTNPHRREDFRRRSLVSDVCVGVIQGFGSDSYRLALRGLAARLDRGQG